MQALREATLGHRSDDIGVTSLTQVSHRALIKLFKCYFCYNAALFYIHRQLRAYNSDVNTRPKIMCLEYKRRNKLGGYNSRCDWTKTRWQLTGCNELIAQRKTRILKRAKKRMNSVLMSHEKMGREDAQMLLFIFLCRIFTTSLRWLMCFMSVERRPLIALKQLRQPSWRMMTMTQQRPPWSSNGADNGSTANTDKSCFLEVDNESGGIWMSSLYQASPFHKYSISQYRRCLTDFIWIDSL